MADIQIDFQDDERMEIEIDADLSSLFLAMRGEGDNLVLFLEADQLQCLSDTLARWGIVPSDQAMEELEASNG